KAELRVRLWAVSEEEHMAQIISKEELPFEGYSWEFQGYHYGNTNISFILVEAQPGEGPKLHSHPYEEVFIVQEGQATFTVGNETIEAAAGQIVIAPASTLCLQLPESGHDPREVGLRYNKRIAGRQNHFIELLSRSEIAEGRFNVHLAQIGFPLECFAVRAILVRRQTNQPATHAEAAVGGTKPADRPECPSVIDDRPVALQ